MITRRSAAFLVFATLPFAAVAQKVSEAPKQPTMRTMPAMTLPHTGGRNPAVIQRAAQLPLDPATKALTNQEPADPKRVERQLGLREPTGVRVNFEGRTPSKQEVLNAFHGK